MFEFIFGLIWTLFMVLFTWGFYFSNGNISVNGQMVTQDEFNAMIFPKVFIGLFWIVGIALMFFGLKKIIRNIKTSKNGIECLGKIIKIYPSGTYINGRPELKADFAVYLVMENKVEVISEIIGMNEYKFPRGAWFKLKYYEGDINVGDMIREDEVPLNIVDMIDSTYNQQFINDIGTDENIIEINGERYMKID